LARVALEIPKVGLVMEQARLVRWLKNVGDPVSQGEPLLELETEKSVVEIEATHSGRLVEQLVQVDQSANVGDQVGWLETDSNVSSTSSEPAPKSVQAPGSPARAATAEVSAGASPAGSSGEAAPTRAVGSVAELAGAARAQPAATSSLAASNSAGAGSARVAPPAANGARASGAAAAASATTPSATGLPNGRIRSSPVARRLAAQNGVDLSAVEGSGPRGRVQLSDVRKAIEMKSAGRATAAASTPQALSSMRRALARAMTLSNATVPQFAVERAVDWTALQEARATAQASLPQGSAKLSVNDFLLQAIARALLSYPALNATFRGDPDSQDAAIVPANGAHIGLVVAVENGLLVPVIHGVEQLGLAELARRRSDAVDRALKGRLKQSELEGATFSLSNLGARGPDRFNAIISPPQSAILAVGRQRDCVVALNGGVHIRPMSDLSLTVDHRVADGRLASEFLAYLTEILEGNEWRVK
jgi:pyruvate dehydrogenase E2 component (dihydrolipoamide acetyltransferase)